MLDNMPQSKGESHGLPFVGLPHSPGPSPEQAVAKDVITLH